MKHTLKALTIAIFGILTSCGLTPQDLQKGADIAKAVLPIIQPEK